MNESVPEEEGVEDECESEVRGQSILRYTGNRRVRIRRRVQTAFYLNLRKIR